MTLERKTEMRRIGAKRLEAFGGRPPFSSLEKPGATPAARPWKRWTDTGPDEETVKLVLKRDNWMCVCCGDPLYGHRGSEWCIGHRKLRAQGVDNSPANLFSSCMACERETHRGPERARQAGWMLKSTEVPSEVPMEHSQHGYVLLLDDGSWRSVQAEFIPAAEVEGGEDW
jgi:hypothetical protein